MYGVRASILVNLLLELNIINVQDIDREMKHLAAGVFDPRAAAWLKRVARYFVINIEQLLQPRRVKAEPRGGSRYQAGFGGAEVHPAGSKYHFSPSGKWVGQGPDTALPSEPSTLEPEEWRTQFHQPEIQKLIRTSGYQEFEPKKAKSKSILWGPPTKKKLEPWMQGYKGKQSDKPEPGTPEVEQAQYTGKLYHFDPIVVRRRELFLRLYDAVNYFNWVHTVAQKIKSEDPHEREDAQKAAMFFRKLETMKTADLDGFNEIMQQTSEFMQEVKENPEKFSSNKPTVVYKFEDGFHWVHLHTSTQMRTEGQRMNHCIGNDCYYRKFETGTHDYYSLRDSRGQPHVSVELQKPNRIQQVKGSGNSKPAPRYQPYLRPFFTHMNWQLVGDEGYVD